MTWRLPAALALSVLVHLAVLWYWRSPLTDAPVNQSLDFEMLAIRLVEPEPPREPEPEPQSEAPIEPETPTELEAPTPPGPVIPQTPAEDTSTMDEVPAETPQPPAAVVLNLSPPAIWDSLVNPDILSRPRSGLEFNPSLSEGVTSRVKERARIGLLSAREREAFGLSDEEYGRTGAAGEVVKVDGQCFSLQETPELGSEPRWWMVKCLDAKTNPFEMKPLETDAKGRAIVD